jgi:hypothetical protein
MQDVAVSAGGSSVNIQSGTVSEQANKAIGSTVEAINVSPNPFMSNINVTINWDKNETANLVLYDVTGREVYRKNIALQYGINRFTVALQSIVPGSYFMKLLTKQNIQTVKLLKQ